MGNQAGEKEETEKARAKAGHRESSCEAAPGRKGKERKNRRLSSWKRKASGRKEASRTWKRPDGKRTRESKAEGKHLRNGCGSESGKSERKRTAKLSTGIWKEGTGNQAGEKEETEKARAKAGTGKATVRRHREEKEKKNRG